MTDQHSPAPPESPGSVNAPLLADVVSYYEGKLAEFGQTPRGVDWKDKESQITRFVQLCKLISSVDAFSVNDLGSGYGSLYDYLQTSFSSFSYTGFDISSEMVEAARARAGGV